MSSIDKAKRVLPYILIEFSIYDFGYYNPISEELLIHEIRTYDSPKILIHDTYRVFIATALCSNPLEALKTYNYINSIRKRYTGHIHISLVGAHYAYYSPF